MTTATQNKPVDTLRERGGLKATIWKNSSAKGNFYSIEISVRTARTTATATAAASTTAICWLSPVWPRKLTTGSAS